MFLRHDVVHLETKCRKLIRDGAILASAFGSQTKKIPQKRSLRGSVSCVVPQSPGTDLIEKVPDAKIFLQFGTLGRSDYAFARFGRKVIDAVEISLG